MMTKAVYSEYIPLKTNPGACLGSKAIAKWKLKKEDTKIKKQGHGRSATFVTLEKW